MMRRLRSLAVVTLCVAACGSRTAPIALVEPAWPSADAARAAGDLADQPVDHVPQPPPVPGFCRGTPVLRVNDLPLTIIKARGGPTQMSCCDGASLGLAAWSPTGQRVDVDVLLGAPPGAKITWPITLDLAHPYVQWAFRFRAIYENAVPDPCPEPCTLSNAGQPEHAGKFVGYIKLQRDADGARRISVCAEGRPADDASTNLWSLRLYAPDVALVD
jgi:hypothetical protein